MFSCLNAGEEGSIYTSEDVHLKFLYVDSVNAALFSNNIHPKKPLICTMLFYLQKSQQLLFWPLGEQGKEQKKKVN